jgi:hypothetical protein
VIICNRKQGHYNDGRICEIMILNEIHYNPATSTFLSVAGLALKSFHTQNMLYTHHKQTNVVYYCTVPRKGKLTIAKLKSPCLSCNVVASLPLESILSKISRYEVDLSDSVVSFISSLSENIWI